MSEFCAGCGRRFVEDDRFCAKCGRARESGDVTSSTSPASDDTATTASSSSSGSKVGAAIGVVAIFCTVIPFLLMFGGSCNGTTRGHVTVSGGPRPAFTFTPTGCESMQPYGRFGANLHAQGENDGGVYVTMDPTRGAAIEVEIPGSCRNSNGTDCTVFSLPRDACRTFEANVDFTGVTVNDVRQVKGHVAVDCSLPDGTTVRGRVTFDGC